MADTAETTAATAVSQDILEDSGYRSRKYWALYAYFALVTIVALAAINWDAKSAARAASALALLPTYGGLLGAGLAAYYGVNWGHSFLAAKAEAKAEAK